MDVSYEEKIVGKFHDTGFGRGFLDMIPKAQATKAKIDKGDYTNLILLQRKGSNQQGEKIQPIEWEKTLANHISHK